MTQVQGQPPQVNVTLDNWYVRYLGIYLQFIGENGVPTPLSQIPEYVNGTIIPNHPSGGDTAFDMFINVLNPEFTILGIPAWPGDTAVIFNVPESATTVRILAGGIGTGADNYPETLLPGAFMTGIMNYGVTALLSALGAAASVGSIVKSTFEFARALALELVTLLGQAISGNSAYSAAFWKAQALAFAKWVITREAGLYVKRLVELVVPAEAEAAAEDSIPIVGWIMLGVSIAAGIANLLETTVEIALSPWTYVNDLVHATPSPSTSSRIRMTGRSRRTPTTSS